MIDAEVARLRKLRNMALRVRAVAELFSADPGMGHPTIAPSALIAWRVARVVSGRLRAHPNLAIQQDPSSLRYFFDRAFAENIDDRFPTMEALAEALAAITVVEEDLHVVCVGVRNNRFRRRVRGCVGDGLNQRWRVGR